MFEIIKAVHEALGIKSTWAFASLAGSIGFLLFAVLGTIFDLGYKNKVKDDLLSAANKKAEPELHLQFNQVFTATVPELKSKSVILIVASVGNTGAPSIATKFQLR